MRVQPSWARTARLEGRPGARPVERADRVHQHQAARLLARIAYGFKKPEHLIALALLDRGGYGPPPPGRV